MAVRIGSFSINISAVSVGLTQGLNLARAGIQGFANQVESALSRVGRIGTLVAGGGLALMVRESLASADALAKTSRALGFSVSSFQALQFGAAKSNLAIEDLTINLRFMNRNISKAAQDIGTAKDVLKELGLSAQLLNEIGPDKAIRVLADALLRVENPGDRARIAVDIFGRAGVKMLPLLERGSKGLDQFQREFQAVGAVLTDEGAKKLEAFNDAMVDLRATLMGGVQTLVLALAPALRRAVELFIEWRGVIRNSIATLLTVVTTIKAIVTMEKIWIAARTTLLALSGPAAWATLVAGATIGVAAYQSVSRAFEGLEQNATTAMNQARRATLDYSEDAAEAMERVRENMEKTAKAQEDLAREAARIFDLTRTPIENFNTEMIKAGSLLQEFLLTGGAEGISPETFRRRAQQLREELERAGFDISQLPFDQLAPVDLPQKDMRLEALKEFAVQLQKSVMTPLERFQVELGKIESAFAAGLIDPETFRRAQIRAAEEFDRTQVAHIGGPRFAGALLEGSQEAIRTIAQAQGAARDPIMIEQKKTNERLDRLIQLAEAEGRNVVVEFDGV